MIYSNNNNLYVKYYLKFIGIVADEMLNFTLLATAINDFPVNNLKKIIHNNLFSITYFHSHNLQQVDSLLL